MNIKSALLLLALMLSACAAPVPRVVSCPPPPPAPAVLTSPVSTAPSLSERYSALMQELQDSLKKATRTP